MPGLGRVGNFKVDIENDGQVSVRLRTLGKQTGKELRDIAEAGARRGAEIMKIHAPRGKTLGLSRRIDWTHARYIAGGAGGGGYYVATAGVRSGDPYPTNVFQGTGIYGPQRQLIRPTAGNVLALYDYKTRDMDRGIPVKPRKGPILTRYIKGQPPQRFWVEAGQDAAQRHVALRLSNFLRGNPQLDN